MECGPPPGLALRSSTTCSMVIPGWILSCACIMVSIETMSPDSILSFGGSFGSSQPHCTVSSVAARRCVLPAAGAFWAMAAPLSNAARTAPATRVFFPGIMVFSLVGGANGAVRASPSSSDCLKRSRDAQGQPVAADVLAERVEVSGGLAVGRRAFGIRPGPGEREGEFFPVLREPDLVVGIAVEGIVAAGGAEITGVRVVRVSLPPDVQEEVEALLDRHGGRKI